jgi:hypothetical protein
MVTHTAIIIIFIKEKFCHLSMPEKAPGGDWTRTMESILRDAPLASREKGQGKRSHKGEKKIKH